jgi:hypothetical protein
MQGCHWVAYGALTSVEHPEAPPCDLDGLEDVAPLLRFSAAGKALPRYLDRLYLFTLQ